MELREKAKKWLDAYKRGDSNGIDFKIEDVAAVVAEYLHETPSGAESEDTSERVKALQTEIEELRKVATEEKTHCEESKDCIRTMEKEIAYRRGQVDAYEFVFYRNRANNRVGGAEVRP